MPYYYVLNLFTKFNRCLLLVAFVAMLPAYAGAVTVNNVSTVTETADGGKIAGKVVDEKGETIPGATVKIVGQSIGAQTSIDGSFSLSVKPGVYTLEFSFVSYQTKRITEVVVKNNEVTTLSVSLKPSKNELKEVVITSSYRKSSVEGVYTRQKNAAGITNGISSEQIAKTPDANLGQSLKRISGLSTFDNKYVIVRGISERYNVATLDGTPLPSTDYSRRNFSFDVIPSEMIESVTVYKTVTPDLPVGFAGGMVQINTRDIPTKNFINFSIGTGFNDQSTGKDLISTKRGKYDYFGFDDGTRKMAGYFAVTQGTVDPANPKPFTDDDIAFSRQFTNNWRLYKYKAQPNQNYTLTFGQSFPLKNADNKIGYIASINYRNTQTITDIVNQRGDFNLGVNDNYPQFDATHPSGYGKVYNFNTTYGGLLNIGFKSKNHSIGLRNTYTRIFSNPLTDLFGYRDDEPNAVFDPAYAPTTERILTEPDFLGLLQNKLQGEHKFGKVKWNWDASRTNINRKRKDMLRREMTNLAQRYGSYFVDYVSKDAVNVFPLSRQTFNLSETDYNWSTSLQRTFGKADYASLVKVGYIGISKKQTNDFVTAYLRAGTDADIGSDFIKKLIIEDAHNNPENFSNDKLVYQVYPFGLSSYSGSSNSHTFYAMVDQKIGPKVRFVGGLRAENFKLGLANDGFSSANKLLNTTDSLIPTFVDKKWEFLPSGNLTYSVNDQLNLRASYSQSIVRPEFNERSLASNYNSELLADVTGNLVVSTKTTSYDIRAEWFPGVGEIISLGAFYKYLDKPLELVQQSTTLYYYNNGKWAKDYGIEAEVRKRLGFINDNLPILDKITVFGNATYIRSRVLGLKFDKLAPVPDRPGFLMLTYKESLQTRPLYGQTPFLLNAGVGYDGDIFGLNIVHNHTGRKFYILTNDLNTNEFEGAYDQTDVQLSANIWKKKGKIRFNVANLFNSVDFYYDNQRSYENIDPNGPELGKKLKSGYSDNFEKDDNVTFSRKVGRTFTVSLNYSF
ncbi:TonB-dependent receptor [Mucilaginibacter celer]|uniref:TonB-dependent receptor n=2 Tax=Mucilaginibacter celer TaxID=2305508 RepID=A0A494VVL9_9SPHI|nr:TonB-dependent receptor [Mucilaginibacter celer]